MKKKLTFEILMTEEQAKLCASPRIASHRTYKCGCRNSAGCPGYQAAKEVYDQAKP